MMTPTKAHPGIALAALALRRGLATAEEVRRALAEQARETQNGRASRDLGLILVTEGTLTENSLKSLLDDAQLLQAPGTPIESAPSPLEKSGRRIGKYVLIRELGRGTAAVTFEAHDTTLGRRVALKVFSKTRAAASHQDEERFVREGRLAASLPPHPHVVSIYDAGCEDGERYIAMELVRGRTFEWWTHAGGPILKSVTLLRDIARAVHHAHEHGVLHRDLKPANILIDSSHAPHVTDFGLAKNLLGKEVSLTGADSVVGTPYYMSPEQAKGAKNIDRRSDVYSLGVMLYEVLTGRPPFKGRTPVETLLKTIQEPVRPPSTVVQAGHPITVDRKIEEICLRALAKSPDERYPTALGFAQDLEEWLTGVKVPRARWRMTRGRILLAVMVAIAILTAGTQWILSRSSWMTQACLPESALVEHPR